MIKEAIVKIVNKEDLTYDEAYTVMNGIMGGETTECCFPCCTVNKECKSRDHRRDRRLCGCDEGTCDQSRNRYGAF